MKRLTFLLALILMMWGCSSPVNMQQPVDFFYPVAENSTMAVKAIPFESKGLSTQEIIAAYLSQTCSVSGLLSLPSELSCATVTWDNKTLCIEMPESIAQLSGGDMTVLLACLTMTLCPISGAEHIRFSCEGASIDGKDYLLLSLDDFICLDHVSAVKTES